MLDDNKLPTLPNGERLNLPSNVPIMFEVEHLRYATLATVSRCGMIWFSEDVIEPSMVYCHYLNTLSTVLLDADDEDATDIPGRRTDALAADASDPANLTTQVQIASILERYFADGDLVSSALTFTESIDHIMDFTSARALHTLSRCSTKWFGTSSNITCNTLISLLHPRGWSSMLPSGSL
jgi:dynein heavy chain 1